MVARFIFAGAERAPEKAAIACNGRRLSYGEFARAIEAMIQRFESIGVAGSGYAIVAVGDLLEHWVISLALRELGLGTIPVGDVETAEQLRLTSIRLVVAGVEQNWFGIEPVCQQRGWRLVRARWGGALARPIEAGRQRVADIGEQVLQTSATTGERKFVLERRAMEPAVMAFVRRAYRFEEGSRVAHFNLGAWTAAGYRMTASVWFSGGEVLMQHTEHLQRPLEEKGLTHGLLLPSLAAALQASEATYPYHPDMVLRIGGMTPSRELVDWARERVTPHVHNTFGSTEAPTLADTLIETDADRRWHQPVPDRGVEVVDEDGRPVPLGQIGRLRVSTRFGPEGYLENPQATAEFFKDGHFYTGDLAMLREDGRFALMGRSTDVINLMGHKRSPEPLEERLCAALGVSAACIVSQRDAAGDEKIHIALETPTPIGLDRLTPLLSEVFAGSGMKDVRVHFLRKLPRNANGKVVRDELRRQVAADSPSD